MRDFLYCVGMPVGVVVAFVGTLFVLGNFYSEYQCSAYQKITGVETRYSQFDVCYVNTKSGWQRWDEYKARIIASEVRK
jgi:hypothetical protein